MTTFVFSARQLVPEQILVGELTPFTRMMEQDFLNELMGDGVVTTEHCRSRMNVFKLVERTLKHYYSLFALFYTHKCPAAKPGHFFKKGFHSVVGFRRPNFL